MRLLRLRLRNWRGVEQQEIEFAPCGVTVISGPNEAGKSSLIEALDMLFDRLDSSSKADLKAVKPVHKDEGPEVEAEVEAGRWRFRYRKRFHKRPLTELEVAAPRPESRTGRDAHQRVLEILEQALDPTLWKALRIAQDAGRGRAELAESRWLRSALDRAAGSGGDIDPGQQSLFEAVAAERLRWWTETGRPKRELTEAQERAAARRAEAEALGARLAELEQELEAEQRLARESVRTAGELAKAEQRAAGHERTLAEIARLRSLYEGARTGLARAEAALEGARAALAGRDRLRRQLEQAALEAGAASLEQEQAAPGREAAASALEQAEQEFARSEQALAKARAEAGLAEADHEFLRGAFDLELMQERRARIEACDRELAEAEALLARMRVTPQALERLNHLREEQIRAEARLAAASTEVLLEALEACAPLLDGRPDRLAAGESRALRAAGPLSIELPGLLRIRIRSGEGVEAPRAELENRSAALREALAECGVASLEEAIAAGRQRGAALERQCRCREQRAQDLRDLSLDLLLQKIERGRALLEDYRRRRAPEPPLPVGLEEAKRRKLSLEAVLEQREAARDQARAVLEQRREGAVRAGHACARAEERSRLLLERRLALEQEAAREERERPRATLEQDLAEAAARRQAAGAEEAAAAAALAALQPDLAEQLARKDAALARELSRRRHDLALEHAGLRARLGAKSEEGLAEKLGAAEAAHLAAAAEARSKTFQAEAARLLHQVLEEERAAEQARYVAPFQERIEGLGRVVFGPDCSVQVGDDLQIESRTLDGRTVPFESLSAGAREQLGVITRLACALLAAEEGGVPVVLDDALGWSDPERLERMIALLGMVGRTCQVILLTCDPARGQGIPGARVVRLGGSGGQGSGPRRDDP